MRYHLLLSPTALDEQERATGAEPIRPGQSLQFVFTPRESGYLYALGRNEQNEPIVIPLGDFTAGVSVTKGEEQAAPQLARVKLNSEPGAEEFTIIFSDKPLQLPFASETLPLDGSFRKLSADERRKIEALRQEAPAPTVRFSGGSTDGAALVMLSPGERASHVVVFDIKLRLER
jgi:hypothetical protein